MLGVAYHAPFIPSLSNVLWVGACAPQRPTAPAKGCASSFNAPSLNVITRSATCSQISTKIHPKPLPHSICLESGSRCTSYQISDEIQIVAMRPCVKIRETMILPVISWHHFVPEYGGSHLKNEHRYFKKREFLRFPVEVDMFPQCGNILLFVERFWL